MKKSFAVFGLACAVMCTLTGCKSYWKVIDPASGRVYYTDHLKHRGSGSVLFKDEVTQTDVTLSSSEVIGISRAQFKANIHGR
jgi:hypothetical protein